MEKVMKRKMKLWLPALILAVSLSGCQGTKSALSQEEPLSGPQTVSLTVWGAEEDEALLEQIIDGFQAT